MAKREELKTLAKGVKAGAKAVTNTASKFVGGATAGVGKIAKAPIKRRVNAKKGAVTGAAVVAATGAATARKASAGNTATITKLANKPNQKVTKKLY